MSEHQATVQRKRRLRQALAIVSALLSVGILSWAISQSISIKNPSDEGLRELPYNEATKAAVDIRVQHTNNRADLTLVALGALWALVIAKRDEARIAFGDRPELVMFTCASVSLVLSILWHEFYLDKLGYFYVLGAKTCFSGTDRCLPDVFESAPLNMLYGFQTAFFVLGVVQAVFTLVSAHRIKGTK